MDRLMKTPWFIKIVAFSLAALLFISINFEPNAKKGSSGFSPLSKTVTETVQDVPVQVNYDRKNLVVSGAPQTVDVTLKGPKSIVLSTKNQRDFTVFIDLADAVIGDQKVPIQIKNMSDKLSAVIKPQQASVRVQEKVTRDYSVLTDFNESVLEDGYIAGMPAASPDKVSITGAKDIIDQISVVKAFLELDRSVNETVRQRVRVIALDRNSNNLRVSIHPSSVDIRVPIQIPSKKVPVIPVQTGNAPEGIEMKSININPKQITVYGKKSVLDKLDSIRLPVDISDINQSTTFDQKVVTPQGIQRVSDDTVSVAIKVNKKADPGSSSGNTDDETSSQLVSKTFSNIKINPIGLPEEYDLTFASPASGTVDVTVTGKSEKVKALKASDIQLSIDASKLQEGTSDAVVHSSLPDEVTGEIPVETVTVNIIKKKSS